MCHRIKNKIKSLENLLQRDEKSKEYFIGLPDYVQGKLLQEAYTIQTSMQLKEKAEMCFKEYQNTGDKE